jgi:hypothetical protein
MGFQFDFQRIAEAKALEEAQATSQRLEATWSCRMMSDWNELDGYNYGITMVKSAISLDITMI